MEENNGEKIVSILVVLLVVGFFKHYFGYIIKLHTLYCNYGQACLTIKKQSMIANNSNLLIESTIESLLYLLLGSLLYKYITNVELFFIIGVILHILAEIFSIHSYFCAYKCKVNK